MDAKLSNPMQAWWMEQVPEEIGKAFQRAETSAGMSHSALMEKAASQTTL